MTWHVSFLTLMLAHVLNVYELQVQSKQQVGPQANVSKRSGTTLAGRYSRNRTAEESRSVRTTPTTYSTKRIHHIKHHACVSHRCQQLHRIIALRLSLLTYTPTASDTFTILQLVAVCTHNFRGAGTGSVGPSDLAPALNCISARKVLTIFSGASYSFRK